MAPARLREAPAGGQVGQAEASRQVGNGQVPKGGGGSLPPPWRLCPKGRVVNPADGPPPHLCLLYAQLADVLIR